MAQWTTTAGLFLLFTVSIVAVFRCDAADANTTTVAAAETTTSVDAANAALVAALIDARQCGAACQGQCASESTADEREACRSDCRTSCRVTCRAAARSWCEPPRFSEQCQSECIQQGARLCATQVAED